MSTSSRLPGCPSSADLSAAVDGSVPEELAVHVESCPACQRDLAVLHRLDRAIRSQLAPPAGLAERIRQRVHEAATATPVAPPRWWLSPVLRLAAAVVITAAAIAVLVHVLNRGAASDPMVVKGNALPGDPLSVNEHVGSGLNRNSSEGRGDRTVPANLPDMVKHVWAVGDAAGERSRVQALLPQGAYEVATTDGNTVFTVRLTDRDLQKLVDRLAADSKWQLASHELPQPRQPDSVALTGRNVRYSLVLVDNSVSRQVP
jgi:hypothetical protein